MAVAVPKEDGGSDEVLVPQAWVEVAPHVDACNTHEAMREQLEYLIQHDITHADYVDTCRTCKRYARARHFLMAPFSSGTK